MRKGSGRHWTLLPAPTRRRLESRAHRAGSGQPSADHRESAVATQGNAAAAGTATTRLVTGSPTELVHAALFGRDPALEMMTGRLGSDRLQQQAADQLIRCPVTQRA